MPRVLIVHRSQIRAVLAVIRRSAKWSAANAYHHVAGDRGLSRRIPVAQYRTKALARWARQGDYFVCPLDDDLHRLAVRWGWNVQNMRQDNWPGREDQDDRSIFWREDQIEAEPDVA